MIFDPILGKSVTILIEHPVVAAPPIYGQRLIFAFSSLPPAHWYSSVFKWANRKSPSHPRIHFCPGGQKKWTADVRQFGWLPKKSSSPPQPPVGLASVVDVAGGGCPF